MDTARLSLSPGHPLQPQPFLAHTRAGRPLCSAAWPWKPRDLCPLGAGPVGRNLLMARVACCVWQAQWRETAGRQTRLQEQREAHMARYLYRILIPLPIPAPPCSPRRAIAVAPHREAAEEGRAPTSGHDLGPPRQLA
jgi:hypothetical protein